MKNLLKTLFPIKLHLTMLQLEEYKYSRFMKWIVKNFFKRTVATKKPLVVTQKINYLLYLFALVLLTVGILALLLTKSLLISLLFIIFLLSQPYIALGFALILLKPYEIYNKNKTIEDTRKKVLSMKSLKVIGVAGSFGKSSTKEILYQLLKDKYKVLRTPESFNTIFGIAKVVDLELDENYEYFICEMAAYQKGEIRTLTYMVPPQFGILTGITTQHFERFGSLENTIQAKFELVDAIENKGNIIFNLEDKNIASEIAKRNIKNPTGFLEAANIKFSKDGSQFDLYFGKEKYTVKTKLFGSANVKNILAAASMAYKLGGAPPHIIERITALTPVDNRLVLSETGVVNNTYSSNPKGFEETIFTAKNVKGTKVLITPGLVELGEMEEEIHKNLGLKARGVFDHIVMVGKNKRTKSFAEGLNTPKITEFINDTREDYFSKLEDLKGKYDWIFLENDITQNY